MRSTHLALCAAALACNAMSCRPVLAQATAFIDSEQPQLIGIYKDLHEHAELSHQEARTSGIVAKAMREAGYTVTERVGKYPDGSQAYGVVGMMKNGPGPTLLVRADMDALPIVEETGVPYASHVTTKNRAGETVGVMHACGHDVHATVLIGTARALARDKGSWHGTLMLIAQPSEETIDGAKAMVADGLYQRFATPDEVIGLHDTSALPAGKVAVISGAAMASSTSIDVLIRGIGGHGSAPQAGRDPVSLAAQFITQMQTIVSRDEDPMDPTVVTVGAIHGGTKRNIIPDEVKLELTTRSFSAKSRQVVIDGLKARAAGLTLAAGLPPDKAVVVTVLEDESTPVLVDDPRLAAKMLPVLQAALGRENVISTSHGVMASEDVGVFGLDGKIPVAYFSLGAADPAKLAAATAAGKALPGPHTSRFEPLPGPTLKTGVEVLTAAAESLLQEAPRHVAAVQ